MATNVPFNDPNEYKYGENEDQNLVKCGCYKGLGAVFPEIHCGWQPQWILIKNVNLTTENWFIFDNYFCSIFTNCMYKFYVCLF